MKKVYAKPVVRELSRANASRVSARAVAENSRQNYPEMNFDFGGPFFDKNTGGTPGLLVASHAASQLRCSTSHSHHSRAPRLSPTLQAKYNSLLAHRGGNPPWP